MSGWTEEFTSKVAPSRIFKFGAHESYKLLPKLLPELVSSAAVIEGDGGVGTIKHFVFTDAAPYKSVRERTDMLDEANFEYIHTMLEGGVLAEKLEWATHKLKIQPSADGGSVCKVTVEYHTKPGVELTEEDMNVDRKDTLGVFQFVEAYLLANPDVCT